MKRSTGVAFFAPVFLMGLAFLFGSCLGSPAVVEDIGPGADRFDLLITSMEDVRWETAPQATFKTVEDRGCYEIAGHGDIVWIVRELGFDLKKYAEKGRVHISFYTDKPRNITGGQLEFNSDDKSDNQEFTFGEFGYNYKLKEGWNDFVIPVTAASKVGNPNWSHIDNIRFYLNATGGSVAVALGDLYIDLPGQ
jgi:hypothetical protein